MMNKVCAITGAYSGLGAALSQALVKEGYCLVLGGRNTSSLHTFVGELKSDRCIAVRIDVKNREECHHFVNCAVGNFGSLDVLINNAGVWNVGALEHFDERDIREMFDVNTFGAIFCAQAAVPIMKRQGNGHIVSIASTTAFDYRAEHTTYSASKAALVAFTACLRLEVQGSGIVVSVVSPGGMKTNLFRSQPDRVRADFMEPALVAEKILQHLRNPTEWHLVLRRQERTIG